MENFDNDNYTNDPNTDAYKIKKIGELAEKLNIPLDARFEEALDWIAKFEAKLFDIERYNEVQARKRRTH